MITAKLLSRRQAELLWPAVWNWHEHPEDLLGAGYEKLPGHWWWLIEEDGRPKALSWARKFTNDNAVVSLGRGNFTPRWHGKDAMRCVLKRLWEDIPAAQTAICIAFSTNAHSVTLCNERYQKLGVVPLGEGGMHIYLMGERNDERPQGPDS